MPEKPVFLFLKENFSFSERFLIFLKDFIR